MPADPLHNTVARRANRKNDEDLEVRRTRGEISCAECRRLKLRCDKKIPCNSCTRRGCPSICPNGSLSTGQGNRLNSNDTTQLQTRVTEMAQRIRQLEDALSVFQSAVSTEVHPLLKEDLLTIKYGTRNQSRTEGEPERSQQAMPIEPIIDSLGSMSIGDRGEGKYFGRSAGAEMLLMAGAEAERLTDAQRLPQDVLEIEFSFPFPQRFEGEIPWPLLFRHLPPEPRAWSLCETYIEHATWKFHPIYREQMVDEIMSPIYKAVKEHKTTGVYRTEDLSAHQFAVLYLIFGIGALMDLTLDALNDEAHLYYHMGAGCISLRSMFDSQDILTVQAILLLGQYKGLGGRRYTMDATWYLTALAVKLAEGLGLHRDSAQFRMDPKIVNRRRGLFWEMFCMDHYVSLTLGRPASIHLSDTDCEFPEDDEATVDDEGNVLVGHSRWRYQFMKDVFCHVTEKTLTAEAPSYQTILELDRKVREYSIPSHLNAFIDSKEDGYTPLRYMKRCLLGQYRSGTLLYLHRSFCVKAMLDHAKNPLQSPYAPSFLAAYRCASGVVRITSNHFERFPELCQRWWQIWTNLFNSVVVLGAIVCRSPTSSIAPTAFLELGLGCELFEKGATNGVLQSEKARSAIKILQTLKSKALRAYSSVRSGPGLPETQVPFIEDIDHGFDELALFGGQTRILVCRWLRTNQICPETSKPACSSSTTPSTSENGGSSPSSDPIVPTPPDCEVHPSLVEFISNLAPLDASIADLSNWAPNNPLVSSDSFASDQVSWEQPSQIQFNPLPLSNSKFANGSLQPSTEMPAPEFFSNSVENVSAPNTYLPSAMSGQSAMNTHWNAFLESSGIIQDGTSSVQPLNPASATSFDFAELQPLQGFY
ncbi:fungal-specific transcription factor domain-containing protein [Crepidotus variabilis]|uniref:Fungal-specific transcription factor domain-containing protein n=1 Tax=Crepidotus variabilis TaxID=179855 RepID=A0A9P6ET80_9AGAR|nr:fungal-specific transcription factor domain-containing protein [Crepidotus variabilis]